MLAEEADESASGSSTTSVDEEVVVPRESSISKELLEREQAYRKRNQALRSKSARIVKETEEVVQEGLQSFDGKIKLGRPNTAPASATRQRQLSIEDLLARALPEASTSARATAKRAPFSAKGSGSISSSARNDTASARSGRKILSLPEAGLIQKIAAKLQDTAEFKDVVPQDIGLEATNRYLKARLLVLEEELDKLLQAAGQKTSETTQSALSALRNDNAKLTKQNQSLNEQLTKQRKQETEQIKKTTQAEAQLALLRKELSTTHQERKQSSSEGTNKDVKLNRALEEVKKLESQLTKEQSTSKELLETHRKTIERLSAEIKRLERQKSELLAGFKKQLQLIDVLKKQKIHLEAAKLLAFTEEEFMKALNWEG